MPNPRWSVALTLLLLAAPFPFRALSTPVSAQSASTAGRTSIATIPDSYTVPAGGWRPSCNVTLTVCAYVAQDGGTSVVVINGKPGPAFDEVKDIAFSLDGGHTAYAAKRGESWLVVADGKEGPAFTTVDNLMFRGTVPIYVGSRPPAPRLQAGQFGGSSDIAGFRNSRKAGEQAVMMVGDREDEIPVVEDRFLGIKDLRVSPDGKAYAYIISMSAGPYGLWLLQINGETIAEDHGLTMFSFLKDGRMAFSRRTGSAADGQARVQIGNEENPEAETVVGDIVSGAASADGRHIAFVNCQAKDARSRVADLNCVLRMDGKVVRQGNVSRPVLAPNGTTLAFAERQADGQSRVTVGDQAGPSVEAVTGDVVFSGSGRRHAYPATLGGKAVVVVDGKPGPAFDSVEGLRFSADSQHLVYGATKDGTHQIVVDQVAGPTTYAWTTEPSFDAAGTAVQFVAQDGRSFFRQTVRVR
jgi:hypothetical protein